MSAMGRGCGTTVARTKRVTSFSCVRYVSQRLYMNRSSPLACLTCFLLCVCVFLFFSHLSLFRTATLCPVSRTSTSSPRGRVLIGPWSAETRKLREAVGASFPGYMIHESGAWSDALQKWVFMPRRISSEAYDDMKDEKVALFLCALCPLLLLLLCAHSVVCTTGEGFCSFAI